MMDKYFEYRKHKTDFNTEVRAGVTTFLTLFMVPTLYSLIEGGRERILGLLNTKNISQKLRMKLNLYRS